MAAETVLVLELDMAGADALENSGLGRSRHERSRRTESWWDTPDRLLHRHGLQLTIWQAGNRIVQSIADLSPPAFAAGGHGEYALRLNAPFPQADPLAPPQALLAEHAAAPQRFAVADIERKQWEFATPRARIAVSLERWQLHCGARRQDFAELHLRGIEGDDAAVFAMARSIDGIAPVRLAVMSGGERAHRLMDAAMTGVKARPWSIGPGATLAQIFTGAAASCIHQYRTNEAMLIAHRAPEGVHQTRVALRRLRSVMWLFRGMVGGPEAQALQARIRSLSAVLGDARDLDVIGADAAGSGIAHHFAAPRDAAYERLEAHLALPDTRSLMIDMLRWIRCGTWLTAPETAELRAAPPRYFAAAALDRAYRKVLRYDRDLAGMTVIRRHDLRKDVKKLRYVFDYLRPLFDRPDELKRQAKFNRRLRDLQKHLGAINDREVRQEWYARLGIDALLEDIEPGGDEPDRIAAAAHACRRLRACTPFWR